MRAGETLAVLGAAGGVGLAAVELGKLMGARVIACASSAEKLAFARRHGADATVNYGDEDLKEALRRATDGKGPDVIYDPVGGRYAEAALRAIAWGGRFLVVGFASGEIPKLPLNLVLLKSCDVRGVFWGAWAERDRAGYRANLGEILAMVRARQAQRPCARELSARTDRFGPARPRRPQGDGEGDPAAVSVRWRLRQAVPPARARSPAWRRRDARGGYASTPSATPSPAPPRHR